MCEKASVQSVENGSGQKLGMAVIGSVGSGNALLRQ